MRHPRVLLLVALVLLAAGTASAETDPRQKSEWLGGAGLLVGFPLGDFADAADTGFGISGHGVFAPGGGVFGIRLQMDVLIYGSRSFPVVAPGTGGLITTDLTTDNWLFNIAVGPQIQARSGPVRPYATPSPASATSRPIPRSRTTPATAATPAPTTTTRRSPGAPGPACSSRCRRRSRSTSACSMWATEPCATSRRAISAPRREAHRPSSFPAAPRRISWESPSA